LSFQFYFIFFLFFSTIILETLTSDSVVLEDPETLHAFSIWDEFDVLEMKLTSIAQVFCLHTEGRKCLIQHTDSNHRSPRSLVVKEIQTTKNCNEIKCFFMNEEVCVLQPISSSEQLLNFATEFFSPFSCFGVPFEVQFNDIKAMKKGYKNILNRWQSILCQKKIDTGWNCCLKCDQLRKALVMKAVRYDILLQYLAQN